jgi:hypothetical protein
MDVAPREEERQRGRVTRDMYMTYLRAWGPALLLPIAFVSIALIGSALEVHPLHLVSQYIHLVTQYKTTNTM